MRHYYNVEQAPCSNCGEKNFRIGKTLRATAHVRELHPIRLSGYAFCLAAVGLASIDMCFEEVGALTIASMVMIGLAVILLFGELYFSILPLKRDKTHHYKCLNCGFSWDG